MIFFLSEGVVTGIVEIVVMVGMVVVAAAVVDMAAVVEEDMVMAAVVAADMIALVTTWLVFQQCNFVVQRLSLVVIAARVWRT